MVDNKKIECECKKEAKKAVNRIEEDSFAKELLKGYKKQCRNWFVAFLVVVFLWFSTIAGFVWFLNQFTFESYTVEGVQDGEGINIIGGGDVAYGAESKNNNP